MISTTCLSSAFNINILIRSELSCLIQLGEVLVFVPMGCFSSPCSNYPRDLWSQGSSCKNTWHTLDLLDSIVYLHGSLYLCFQSTVYPDNTNLLTFDICSLLVLPMQYLGCSGVTVHVQQLLYGTALDHYLLMLICRFNFISWHKWKNLFALTPPLRAHSSWYKFVVNV